jgi:hypothetical protein
MLDTFYNTAGAKGRFGNLYSQNTNKCNFVEKNKPIFAPKFEFPQPN